MTPPPSRRIGAVAGIVAAAAALGAGELTAALMDSQVSPVTAVGTEFIERFAASLKDLAVALFGTNDKVALIVGIVVVSLVLGAVFGVLHRRHPAFGWAGFAAFGFLGAWAMASDPQGTVGAAVISALVAVVVGVAALTVLFRLATRPMAPSATEIEAPSQPQLGRRAFALGAGAFLVAAASGAAIARTLRNELSVESVRRRIGLPRPSAVTTVPTQPFTVDALSPYVTPTADFYRIDTALRTPQVAAEGWRLRFTGMVDNPFEITYDELLALDSVEAPVTIACVSNEVGGNLIGNAVWQGVPLASLLERAGVAPAATQLVGRSVDGFTAGFPTELAIDGRTALVAYAMNGEPLTADHGYPVRLIVAGLYGYVSATKWLEEIELTTWEGFDGFWIPRGWSKEGPIKTHSRIDVPRSGASLSAGPQPIAGVAWAPDLGISKVEVQVDDGPWVEAKLGAVASSDTWVQWLYEWDATPGDHEVRVRATDNDGYTQTSDTAPPAPNGATGWHHRRVSVA